MKKYLYVIGVSILIVILFTPLFAYFNYDGDFLIGWFACMGYYMTFDYHKNRN